jgi:K+-transporting ATPase ATPase B chain
MATSARSTSSKASAPVDHVSDAPASGVPRLAPKGARRPLFEGPIVRRAMIDAVRKLDPRVLVKNPVMFVV